MPDTHAKILALYGEAQKAASDIAQSIPSISIGGGSGAATLSVTAPSPSTSTAPICNASPLAGRPTAWRIAGQAHALVARNMGPLLATSVGHVAAAGAVLALLVSNTVIRNSDFSIALFSFVLTILAANAIMIWIRRADGRDSGGFLAYLGLGKRAFKVMLLAIVFNVVTSVPFFVLESAHFPEPAVAAYSLFVAYLMFRLSCLYLASVALDDPLSVVEIWKKGRNNLLRLFGVIVFCMTPGVLVSGILFRVAISTHDEGVALGVVAVALVAAISSLASLGAGLQKLDESL